MKLFRRLRVRQINRKIEQLDIELKQLVDEVTRLEKQDRCLITPCMKCIYLRRIDSERFTCKREEVLKEIEKVKEQKSSLLSEVEQ